MQQYAESLRSHWQAATPEAQDGGRSWYGQARAAVFRLSMEFGLATEAVAGVVAALSQQCRWDTNLDRAERLLSGEDYPGGLPLACEKACRIRDGEDPEAVLGHKAFKVQAFWRALVGDDDAAVVDTWMLTAFGWPGGYSKNQYRALADIIRSEAAAAGVPTTMYQATVWCQVRGRVE